MQLLTAIERKEVPAGDIDASRRQRLLRFNDEKIKTRAAALLSGAIESNRQQVLDQHGAVLTMTGDAQAGAAVFAKRCAVCHRLRGVGHEVGPNLASLTDYSPQALLTAMLDPNRAVEAKFLDYVAADAVDDPPRRLQARLRPLPDLPAVGDQHRVRVAVEHRLQAARELDRVDAAGTAWSRSVPGGGAVSDCVVHFGAPGVVRLRARPRRDQRVDGGEDVGERRDLESRADGAPRSVELRLLRIDLQEDAPGGDVAAGRTSA